MAGEFKLECVVLTPDADLFKGPVEFVAMPAFDGEIGVLPGHAALVTRLGEGPLRVHGGEGKHFFYVRGGFAEVFSGRVTVLAEKASPVEDPTEAKADSMLEEARAMPVSTLEERTARDEAMRHAYAYGRIARDAGK